MRSNNRLHKAIVGTYNRICDKSGMTFKRSELMREQRTNILCHPKFADPWHPQDFPQPTIKERRVRID